MSASSLKWSDLKADLLPWLSSAISSMGFEQMTPVQASTIPLFLKNKDVIVEAVTGSGKTLSFVIPIIQKLKDMENTGKCFNVVVISPTRELSLQIDKVFESVLKFNPVENGIRTQVVVGGVQSLQDDLREFQTRKPQILIATPGRLSEFVQHTKYVSCKKCEIMVLDEADKLLDLNFSREMNNIFETLPKQKRVGLFSATILNASENFHKTGMRNPMKIVVNAKNHKPNTLLLNYSIIQPQNKLKYLFQLLQHYHFRKSIVYFPTCISVDYFYSLFKHIISENQLDLKFYSLHGKLKTQSRIKTLKAFEDSNDNEKAILMTTDVAARGIDIENVDLVIQLDPPTDPDVFLHRCGRTGRANNAGQAIVLLTEGREEDYVDFMRVRKTELDELDLDDAKLQKFDKFEAQIKKWMLVDRVRHDKGVRAFVSFARYYSKHTASSIFRLQELDYIGIAKAYGLLRLPRMPEIKSYVREVKDGYIDESVNFDEFKYKDPVQEEERVKELKKEKIRKERQEKKKEEAKIDNTAWSKKKLAKEVRNERTIVKDSKKRVLDLEEGNSSDEEQTDWKDLVRQSKKNKSSDIGKFDDL